MTKSEYEYTDIYGWHYMALDADSEDYFDGCRGCAHQKRSADGEQTEGCLLAPPCSSAARTDGTAIIWRLKE